MKTITKNIEDALVRVTDDFPELLPLLGARRRVARGTMDETPNIAEEKMLHEKEQKQQEQPKIHEGKTASSETRLKKAGMTIALEEYTQEPNLLGRMVDEVIMINALHPAWKKALQENLEEYHIVLTVGLVLSGFLDPEKHPQEFLGQLLHAWGTGEEKHQTLF